MSAASVSIAPVGLVRASALPATRRTRRAASVAAPRRFEDARIGCRRGDAQRVRVAHPDEGFTDGNALATVENQDLEMKLGRAAMVGFFFTTVGDVVTRGEGPVEQLRDEQMFLLNHINPATVAKDILEVGGIYVESVFIVWLCLAAAFILASSSSRDTAPVGRVGAGGAVTGGSGAFTGADTAVSAATAATSAPSLPPRNRTKSLRT